MTLLRMVGVAVGFPIVTFVFGWAVLAKRTDLDREERFTASWGVGFTFMAFCQMVAFMTHRDRFVAGLLAIAAMAGIAIAVTARGRRQRGTSGSQRSEPGLRPLATYCGIGYLQLLGIQAVLPIYAGGAWYLDWWMHYDEALVFLGVREVGTTWVGIYTLASRTPLYNLVLSFLMSIAGDEFFTFQVGSTLTNFAFVPALYLVLRDMFGRRTARIGVLFATLNVWIMHEAWFTWPKALAVYFLLCGLHSHIQFVRTRGVDRRAAGTRLVDAGICWVLAFMTHQSALAYMAPMVVHAAFLVARDRSCLPSPRQAAFLLPPIVAVAAPWYIWLAATYGAAGTVNAVPTLVANQGVSFALASITSNVAANTALSFISPPLVKMAFEAPPSASKLYWIATRFYFHMTTGALTVSLAVFLLSRFAVRGPAFGRDAGRGWFAVALFIVPGALLATALLPVSRAQGVAPAACMPSVVVLVALGWAALAAQGGRWTMAVVLGMATEYLFMLWSHVLVVSRTGWLDLEGNALLKQSHRLVFLADEIGSWGRLVVPSLVVVQLSLVVLLVKELSRGGGGPLNVAVRRPNFLSIARRHVADPSVPAEGECQPTGDH